jgi:ATP-dependent DNA ligase
LADALKPNTPYRLSEVVDDGHALFEAAKTLGLEGVMAKEKNSPYQPGKRSAHWLKIKTRQTVDCVIIGYTAGKGNRASEFGALHLAVEEQGTLRYVGKVGTGFDTRMMKQIFAELTSLKKIKRPVKEKPLDDSTSTYIEPKLICEVEYASWTKDKMLREPVFVRMRPDVNL